MSVEIERKFLVLGDDWRGDVTKSIRIRQAYLRADEQASIRVRIRDDGRAVLTVKTSRADLRRLEFEYDIPVIEAEALLSIRRGVVVEKVRHIVPYGGLTWEVDVFESENAGLRIAEVELTAVDQVVAKPRWAGLEVTTQGRYYNGSLAQAPFSTWSSEHRAQACA